MAQPPPAPRTRRAIEAQNRASPQVEVRGANPGVAGRLHEAVRAAGGNQAVARRSGVPLATVNNYVRGRNGMKIGPLAALAVACNVSLEWLVAGGEASATALLADPDYPAAMAAPPPGLAEAQAESSPADMTGGIDVRILVKAIEIVAAIAGAADFLDDPKELARRIATTYAVLIEPEASRE
jgi:transcriptional regulator with XRE-family HTH domain